MQAGGFGHFHYCAAIGQHAVAGVYRSTQGVVYGCLCPLAAARGHQRCRRAFAAIGHGHAHIIRLRPYLGKTTTDGRRRLGGGKAFFK